MIDYIKDPKKVRGERKFNDGRAKEILLKMKKKKTIGTQSNGIRNNPTVQKHYAVCKALQRTAKN
jgi:hypothetical protein